jgi:hypothetical protein
LIGDIKDITGKIMPAKTISDAFLAQGRARKIVSMTELQAQLESNEEALELTGAQKLARAFNRSAVVCYVKSVTIGAWRANKMPLYKNNVQMGTFDVKTSAKTSEKLGQEAALELGQDQFVNGMAISAMLNITSPNAPIDGDSVKSKIGTQLLAAFDACQDYSGAEYGLTFTSHAAVLQKADEKKRPLVHTLR